MPENTFKPSTMPAGLIPFANPQAHAAVVARSTSGAAGIHLDGRDRRARTRGAATARALSDQETR